GVRGQAREIAGSNGPNRRNSAIKPQLYGARTLAPKETLVALLDHLIGASEERLRQVEVKHLRGLQIAESSAGSVVGTEKLGHGPRYRFRLFQQQKMPGIGEIDDQHPLPQLRTQRIPIPRRRRVILEPLDHEKGGSTGVP